MEKEILNSKEAADLLRVSVKTLLDNVKKNIIPAKKIGREYRFQRTALLNMLINY